MMDRDQRLTEAVATYFQTGEKKDFLNEAWIWTKHICMRRFGMDEDGSSEVMLRIVQSAERCLEIYRSREYGNFPAYFTVYVKNQILNQRKRESVSRKKERILMEVKGSDIGTRETVSEMRTSEEEILRILMRKALAELETLPCLVVKMRHRIPMNLRELKLLKGKLKRKSSGLRAYFMEEEEYERSQRLRRKAVTDQLQVFFGRTYFSESNRSEKWRKRKKIWADKMAHIGEEQSFRRIAVSLALSEHTVRKVYYDAIRTMRDRRVGKEFHLSLAA
ncbi:hypothetical protein EHO60_10790 [Leptospira fletcheri]|uniref:Sigma-70 family RNA polymerase sigma factor n=1 Tax=Leptospira fletcheri TaxID=2484981 RepID=A0A4R9GET8_9LEPT|nr:hypothetical protein [Leptospira fletcheri]TGK10309.1 hypothetical protein EHO60_10790 [Leptospira fletcheri]